MITDIPQTELLEIIHNHHQGQQQQMAQPEPEPQEQLTCIQRASSLIDQITDSLCLEIMEGLQIMNKRKRLPALQQQNDDPKKKINVELPKVDEDQHKKMIRKFMRMNRKFQKIREKRSIQVNESISKLQVDEQRRKFEERNKTLQARKSQISERLKAKEDFKNQLNNMIRQSNQRLKSMSKIKPLYVQKQQKFTRQFILPKIEQEKRILQTKKEIMKRIDITQLLQHQKIYEEKRNSDRINRSLTSRVMQIQNHYQPPKYVPKSFLIAEAQEEFKKEQQKVKAQEVQVNEYRKKEFLKMLEEKQKRESEQKKDTSLQKSRSKKSISAFEGVRIKQKQKIIQQLTREETKKRGDDYMKELIKQNRKRKQRAKVIGTQVSSEKTLSIEDKPKTSEYEIEVIKQQKVQKFHKIRVKKIDDILNNNHFDKHFKLQRLAHQNEKINQLVELKKDKIGKIDDGEVVSLYLSSIHTKLAILQVVSPKRQQRQE